MARRKSDRPDEDRVVNSFYDGVVRPDGWLEALDGMATLFDAQATALPLFDALEPRATVALGQGVWTQDAMARYARDFAALDPAAAAYAAMPLGQSESTDKLIPADKRKHSVFYHEFYRPLGLHECLGGPIFRDATRFGLVGVQRGVGHKPFEREDYARLNRLMPHMARAFQLRRAFSRLELRARLLSSVIDRAPTAMIVRRPDGRADHVNRAAQLLLARADGLRLDRGGKLRARERTADLRLTTLQNDVLTGGAGGIARVPRSNGGRSYAVLVAPLPTSTSFDDLMEDRRLGLLLTLHDPDAATPEPADVLARSFGLSPRAADLVAALASGEELRSYAERVGLTYHTARFHLKAAFARLDVRSQSQLVRLAVRALAELAAR